MNRYEVAIVGSGFSGLTSAHYLKEMVLKIFASSKKIVPLVVYGVMVVLVHIQELLVMSNLIPIFPFLTIQVLFLQKDTLVSMKLLTMQRC